MLDILSIHIIPTCREYWYLLDPQHRGNCCNSPVSFQEHLNEKWMGYWDYMHCMAMAQYSCTYSQQRFSSVAIQFFISFTSSTSLLLCLIMHSRTAQIAGCTFEKRRLFAITSLKRFSRWASIQEITVLKFSMQLTYLSWLEGTPLLLVAHGLKALMCTVHEFNRWYYI